MPRAAPKRAYKIAKVIKEGFEIPDQHSNTWVVGEIIGQGGFGRLYAASSNKNPKIKDYVLKIEPQENGPLFTETHFYTRVCKQELCKSIIKTFKPNIFPVDEWKVAHHLDFLGIPRFISKGLFVAPDNQTCRFLVMQRFHGSLEDCLTRREFAPADIPRIAIQTVDALEYIHSKDYVHTDIKASNLLRGSADKFYLADFGLVTQYRVGGDNGNHRPEKASPKLRDNGTFEFCSRDAHAGLPPSRRGDLEILLFNLVHWLYRARPNAPQGPCAGLPWEALIGEPAVRANVPANVRELVVQSKSEAMDPAHTSILVDSAGLGRQPALESLVRAVGGLGYTESPDYARCRSLLKALAKSLEVTAATSRQNNKHVLVEVNTEEDPGKRVGKISKKTEGSVVGPSRRTPAGARSRVQVSGETCRETSHLAGDEETEKEEEEDEKASAPTTKAPAAPVAVRPPTRRSARTRRAMNLVFEPSDEESDGVEANDDEDFVPSPRRQPRQQSRQKQPKARGRLAAAGVATQTSPRLLQKLEREERRRNFF